MSLNWLTIKEAAVGLKAGEFSSVDLTNACLDRIRAVNGEINAVVEVVGESALKGAQASDARRAAGKSLGDFDGIPVLVKDNLQAIGTKTTAASKMLANYQSTYDATAVAKLRAAGAVILGKVNMDEFAMGSSTETSAHGPTKNPWDLKKIPGGTSGGSAAAVAAGMCPLALGSDTGGSIRQPAAMCGVTGFKPTYGRVSRHGLLAMTSSFDQVGPVVRTAEDAKLALGLIEGQDPFDSTSTDAKRYVWEAPTSLKGVRLGVPKEYFVSGMDAEVERSVRQALTKFESLGAELVEVSLPSTKHALAVYYVLMPCEASANLARFDGMRFGYSAPGKTLEETYFRSRGEGFGAEVRRRILLGTYALSSGYYDAYYLQAQKARTVMRQEFAAALSGVDCLVAPTSPSVAWDLGEKFDDPIAMYLSDIYTVSVNVVGAPAVSIPAGLVRGLPVGLQLIGRQFEDDRVLAIARLFQEATDHHLARPMI